MFIPAKILFISKANPSIYRMNAGHISLTPPLTGAISFKAVSEADLPAYFDEPVDKEG